MENIFIESLMDYYGLDWLAMLCGLYGTVLIERKSKWAFVAWTVMGVCGCIVASMSHQFGYLVYNAIAIFMYYRSLKTWAREEQQDFVAAE